ncbi:MAG: hypothetical protein IKF72_02680 [Kiritimatiellae bacterium]|nr:hypothetical protein [Kiritimatiellia bacterium]
MTKKTTSQSHAAAAAGFMAAAFAFSAMSAGSALAEEVNLKTLAAKDGSGNLIVYSNSSEVWATGREADKAFDGDTGTYYDPKSAAYDTYVGYGLERPCVLTRIRYYPRNASETPGRLQNCVIQGANSSDFSDAIVLYDFSGKVPADLYPNLRWLEVEPTIAASFSYFRIYQRRTGTENTFAGNTAELEFYGVDDGSFQLNLSTARGDYPEVANVLKWSPAFVASSSETTILRAFGAGGPWTEVARLNGVNTWADTTAPGGTICYYRAITRFVCDGDDVLITNQTAVAAPLRWRLLERDPSDMTQLRSGVNLIYTCGTGGNLCWTPTTGITLTAVTNSLMFAFNDVLWRDSGAYSPAGYQYYYDFADTKASNPTCIGVDLGEPAHFTHLRFYPVARAGCNSVVGTGSNSENWSTRGNFTILTKETSGVEQGDSSTVRWIELESFDTETAYRYLFCHSTIYNGWNNNVSELQFYGWLESEVAGLAVGATDISLTCGTSPSVTLTWTPVKYGSTYKIDRKTGDGAWTTVASDLSVSATTWTDTGVVCDGTRYTYRVTTVNGANEAYSEEIEIRPYVAGNGTGLHGEWWTNYGVTTGGETLALVATNAAVDIANANVGGATENIFARWSGKLIAPYAGDFTFEADADGVLCLWIDGSPALHKTAASGTVALTAGEHDITVTWLHGSGSGHCSLLWGGIVPRGVIPSTQLVPVAPQALPEGWTNARLFARSESATCVGDVRVNGDGTLDFAYGGEDLSYSNNGYNFMWQAVKGDFTLKAVMQSLAWDNSWWGPKAGLMVRSSLDASSMMRVYGVKRSGGYLYVVGRQKTLAAPSSIYEQKMIDGKEGSSISYAPTLTHAKLQRVGNTFTFFYRTSSAAPWTKLYEYEDTNGEYGETVYVGPAAFGEGAGTGNLAVPYYRWRFSNVQVRPIVGMKLIIR